MIIFFQQYWGLLLKWWMTLSNFLWKPSIRISFCKGFKSYMYRQTWILFLLVILARVRVHLPKYHVTYRCRNCHDCVWILVPLTAPLFSLCQGQMVARGTYGELQGSGLDFTLLLKEEEEAQGEGSQGRSPIPGSVSHFPHTLSDNSMSSMSSLSSSRYSLIEGAEPLAVVGIF